MGFSYEKDETTQEKPVSEIISELMNNKNYDEKTQIKSELKYTTNFMAKKSYNVISNTQCDKVNCHTVTNTCAEGEEKCKTEIIDKEVNPEILHGAKIFITYQTQCQNGHCKVDMQHCKEEKCDFFSYERDE